MSESDLDGASAGLAFDDPINIQYTSGTTGFPKGATLPHHNILNNGFFVAELLGYTQADRVCLPVPFYHCFGMVMGNLGSTTHGSTIVIPAPLFDPAATLRAVVQERCTSLYGVPTMFIAELGVDGFAGYDLTSLRTGLMAGSPCPVEIMKRVLNEMHMGEVGIAYGMTETSPVSTQTRADDDLGRRTSTVGRAMPHIEIKIVDPATGLVVPTGASGEICTRGYSVMLGYWEEPERTAEAIDGAGWMHTGDLAVMREDGYVNIVGRIKDLVIRGGENLYPREIEEFLFGHPDIEDVSVIGVPDARYGEELMAWIRMRPGAAPLDAAAVREFCSGRIAHQKIPALRQGRRRFPHDGHREDPQGRDAPDQRARARPSAGGRRLDRLIAARAARATAWPANAAAHKSSEPRRSTSWACEVRATSRLEPFAYLGVQGEQGPALVQQASGRLGRALPDTGEEPGARIGRGGAAAPWGRLSTASQAPAVSARAMMAPPCMTPPEVQT